MELHQLQLKMAIKMHTYREQRVGGQGGGNPMLEDSFLTDKSCKEPNLGPLASIKKINLKFGQRKFSLTSAQMALLLSQEP